MMFRDKTQSRAGRAGAAMAAALVGALMAMPAAGAMDIAEELTNTFKNGEFDVNFRYRYEFVDQDDNGLRDANASTLRTRLVYKTAKWYDLDLTLNLDDVRTIVGSNFNDTRNGKSQYQTVADPKGANLNIAALTYTGLENTTFVLGRQRILRNNVRFIGNVGWRQNEQTYDGLSATYKDDVFQASYAYIDRVNRIFGPEAGSPTDAFHSNSHLLDASYTLNEALSVAVYGYLLDFKNGASSSNQTFGVRFTGMPRINEDMAVTYTAEYATQDDYEDNTTNYDADYVLAELGLKWKQYAIKAGYELLEGNGLAGQSFQTPLATLHAHNGWADKFLSTPDAGLQDISLTASAKVSKGSVSVVLHDYEADTGGVDYGNEIDFVVKWPLAENISVLGKVALYNADNSPGNPTTANLGQDTTKAWVMLTAGF